MILNNKFSSSKLIGLKIFTIVIFISVLTVNYLANAIPIGGITTGQASESLPNLFTPIGFTFSIWGLIYLGLTFFCVFIFFIPIKYEGNYYIILQLFILNCILNISWILAWHHRYILISLLIMIGLLITLILISNKFDEFNSEKKLDYKIVISQISFNIYFAWIVVATFANFTTFLVHIQWNISILDPEIWTTILIFIITLLSMYIYNFKNSLAFIITVIWGIYGVYSKHISMVYDYEYSIIIIATITSILTLLIFTAVKKIIN